MVNCFTTDIVNFIKDVCTSLLANVISFIIAGLITYFIYIVTKRRKLLKFFGIETTKKLTIFTSSLNVEKYGSLGHEGIAFSFRGIAIPNEEAKAAAELKNHFNYFLPSQEGTKGLLSKILISDIDVKIFPAPEKENPMEKKGSIISLGFPPYNVISKYIEDKLNPQAIHSCNPKVISNDNVSVNKDLANYAVTSGSSISIDKHGFIPTIKVKNIMSFDKLSVGFIQKIFDSNNQQFFFYIAGLSENSTAGSAYYLINHWEELNKLYGDKSPFCILLDVCSNNNQISQIIHKS